MAAENALLGFSRHSPDDLRIRRQAGASRPPWRPAASATLVKGAPRWSFPFDAVIERPSRALGETNLPSLDPSRKPVGAHVGVAIGGERSAAIMVRMAAKTFRGTATSAI